MCAECGVAMTILRLNAYFFCKIFRLEKDAGDFYFSMAAEHVVLGAVLKLVLAHFLHYHCVRM